MGGADWTTLEVFVVEASITPKYLRLLYPGDDAVWEIRSVRHDPSLRVLGLFPVQDAFVSTEYARRDLLGGWETREWKIIKRRACAIWRNLFFAYDPIVTLDVKKVCTGATDEIFYKERG